MSQTNVSSDQDNNNTKINSSSSILPPPILLRGAAHTINTTSTSSSISSSTSNSLPSKQQYDQQQQQHRMSNEQFQYPPQPPGYLSDQRFGFNYHPPLPSIPSFANNNNNNNNNNINGSVAFNQPTQQYLHYPMIYDSNSLLQQQQQPQMIDDRKHNASSRSKSDPSLLPISSQPLSYIQQQQEQSSIITQKDIKIIKTLLPISENHKWRYLSHKISKIRSKKFSSELVKVKYHEIFGLPYSNHRLSEAKYNIEGLIGSSLPYLVADNINNSNDDGYDDNIENRDKVNDGKLN